MTGAVVLLDIALVVGLADCTNGCAVGEGTNSVSPRVAVDAEIFVVEKSATAVSVPLTVMTGKSSMSTYWRSNTGVPGQSMSSEISYMGSCNGFVVVTRRLYVPACVAAGVETCKFGGAAMPLLLRVGVTQFCGIDSPGASVTGTVALRGWPSWDLTFISPRPTALTWAGLMISSAMLP